jgi:hypothetical protein
MLEVEVVHQIQEAEIQEHHQELEEQVEEVLVQTLLVLQDQEQLTQAVVVAVEME